MSGTGRLCYPNFASRREASNQIRAVKVDGEMLCDPPPSVANALHLSNDLDVYKTAYVYIHAFRAAGGLWQFRVGKREHELPDVVKGDLQSRT